MIETPGHGHTPANEYACLHGSLHIILCVRACVFAAVPRDERFRFGLQNVESVQSRPRPAMRIETTLRRLRQKKR
jgi:hypothetical protein